MRSGSPAVSEVSTTMLFEKVRTALLADTLTAPGQATHVAVMSFFAITQAMGCFALVAFFWVSSSWARLCDPFGMSKAPAMEPRAIVSAKRFFITLFKNTTGFREGKLAVFNGGPWNTEWVH